MTELERYRRETWAKTVERMQREHGDLCNNLTELAMNLLRDGNQKDSDRLIDLLPDLRA